MKRYAAKRTVECWVDERLPPERSQRGHEVERNTSRPRIARSRLARCRLATKRDPAGIRGPKPRYALKQEFGRALAIGFGHDGCGVAVTDLSASAILDGADRFSEPATSGWVDRDPTRAIAIATDLARAAVGCTNWISRCGFVLVKQPAEEVAPLDL
jgi:hypothetical protein